MWVPAGLGAVAGLVQVGKTLAVAGPPAPWPLVIVSGLAGVVALAGAALARPRPRAGALIMAVAGLAAITIDTIGSPPPRVLPGAVLVIAGAIAFASAPAGHGAALAAPIWARRGAWVGLALQLVVGLPLVAAGLVAPGWAVTAMWAAWGALFVLALSLRRTRPWLVLAVPPATAAILFGALWLGGHFLGWTT